MFLIGMGKLEDFIGNRWLRLTAVSAQCFVLLRAIGAAIAWFWLIDTTCGRPAAIVALMGVSPFVVADVWKEAVKLLEEVARLKAAGPIILPRAWLRAVPARLFGLVLLPFFIVFDGYVVARRKLCGRRTRRSARRESSFSRPDVEWLIEADRILARETFKPASIFIASRQVRHIAPLPPRARGNAVPTVVPIEAARRGIEQATTGLSWRPGKGAEEIRKRPPAPRQPRVMPSSPRAASMASGECVCHG